MSPAQYLLAFLLWYRAVALQSTSTSATRHLKIDHTGTRGLHPSSSSSSLKASTPTGNFTEGHGRSLGGIDDIHDMMGAPSAKGSNSVHGAWSVSDAAYSSDDFEEGNGRGKPGFFTPAADVDTASGKDQKEDDKLKGGPRGGHHGRNPPLPPRPGLRERRSTAPWFTVGLLPAQSLPTSRLGYFQGKGEGEMESLEDGKGQLGQLNKSWNLLDGDARAEEGENKMLDAVEENEDEEEEAEAARERVGGGVVLGAGLRAFRVRNPFPAVMPFLKSPSTAKRHTGRLSINGALSSLADMLLAESYRREGSSMRSGLHNAGRRR